MSRKTVPYEHTWKEKLYYEFDNLMSQPGASLGLLLTVTGMFTLVGGWLYYCLHSSGDIDFFESLFRAWTFVADPGSYNFVYPDFSRNPRRRRRLWFTPCFSSY